MPARPALLFVAPTVPASTGNGLAMRNGIFLEAYARRFEVTLVVASPADPQPSSPEVSIATPPFSLALSPFLLPSTAQPLSVGGSVIARAHVDAWRVGLRLSAAAPATLNVTIDNELRGTVSGTPLWAAAQGQRCFGPAALPLCAGLDLGARLLVATATGARLYRTGTTLTATPTVGATFSTDVTLWRGLTLGVHLVGLFPLLPSKVTIEGAPSLDFGSTFEALLGLSIGWTWNRPQ